MDWTIIAVCAAVVAFFAHHIVAAVLKHRDKQLRQAEIKELRDRIDEALSGTTPDLRLACALRARLRELGEIVD